MARATTPPPAFGIPLTRREPVPTNGKPRSRSDGPPRRSCRGTYRKGANPSPLIRSLVGGNRRLLRRRKRIWRWDSQTRIVTSLSRHTGDKELQRGITLMLPGPPRSSNRKTWDDSGASGLLGCMANLNPNPNPNLSPKRSRRRSQAGLHQARPHLLRRDALCAFRILPSPESHRIS